MFQPWQIISRNHASWAVKLCMACAWPHDPVSSCGELQGLCQGFLLHVCSFLQVGFNWWARHSFSFFPFLFWSSPTGMHWFKGKLVVSSSSPNVNGNAWDRFSSQYFCEGKAVDWVQHSRSEHAALEKRHVKSAANSGRPRVALNHENPRQSGMKLEMNVKRCANKISDRYWCRLLKSLSHTVSWDSSKIWLDSFCWNCLVSTKERKEWIN